MKEDSIVVDVKLTEKDFEDFFAHLGRRSILMKMLIAVALIVFVAQLIRIIADPQGFESAIIWVALVILLFLMMIYSNKYNARKVARNNKRLFEPHTYYINDREIRITGAPFNATIKWEDLYRVTESKNSLFLWLNKKQAQILPKRSLQPEEAEVIKMIADLETKHHKKK